MKIWGRFKKFKLKIIGLCFIFILTTPALLPTISSSLIQTRDNQQLNDISILIFLDFSQKKIPDPTEFLMEEKSSNPDLGEIQVKLLASIYQVGGLTARNCKIEWEDNTIYYNHPFEEEIVVSSQILTIKFSADVIYFFIPVPVTKTYDNIDLTSHADIDECVHVTPLQDKLYFSLDFPSISFATNLTVQQNDQEVVEIDTNRPFKVNFSLNNLKTEIFQGNWTLYQKIGDAENSSIFSGDINMGEGIQWIEREIDLTGGGIPSDTPISYYVEIESDSFWQRTEEVSVMANPTKPFIAGIELEWEDWYEAGIFNYGEPYTITIDIFNPTTDLCSDILIINETLGSFYNGTLFNDSIILEPGEHNYIILEEQVIDWEIWKWFDNETGEIYNNSLDYVIFPSLTTFNPNGLKIHCKIEIQEEKINWVHLLAFLMHSYEVLGDYAKYVTLLGIGVCTILSAIAGIVGGLLGGPAGAIISGAVAGVICSVVFAIQVFHLGDVQGDILWAAIIAAMNLGQEPPIPNFEFSSYNKYNEQYNCSENCPIKQLYEYINLFRNFNSSLNSTYGALVNYNIGCVEKNISNKMEYANKYQNLTRINRQILKNITEIHDDVWGIQQNIILSELEKNNLSYESLISNLTIIEEYIEENNTFKLELIENLQEMGYNESQIEELLKISQTFDTLINFEKNVSRTITNSTQEFLKIQDEIILEMNPADEIVALSETNNTSKINITQNYDASKRADIKILPTSTNIVPGQLGQFNIEIENLLEITEPFNIQLENVPSEWIINYQSELNISGLTTEEIPINISIPKSANEFPRVVPLNIIISNTVVDLNSSVLVSVRPYHEVKLEIDEEILEMKPEEIFIHSINVTNLGNVEDTFELYLEGIIPNSLLELEENTFIFQPNEYKIIPLNVTILENWASIDNQSYNLTLTVISSDQVTKQSLSIQLMIIATFKSMIYHIISEISELKNAINNTLDGFIKNSLLNKLDCAIILLNDSVIQYEGENYIKTIILDKLAKINLKCSEIIVWIGDFINQIEADFSKYIISSLHEIRNYTTLAMGRIIDTPLSFDIAQIEIDILEITDNIYNYSSVSFIDAILININLWQAAECLDLALINLANDDLKKTSNYIQITIINLKQTKHMISLLHWLGSVSGEDAQIIKDKIDINIDHLKALI
ncbi:MAG: hypothetical protein ACTSRG_25325 [Candidatus Helarchaeota archaeon]